MRILWIGILCVTLSLAAGPGWARNAAPVELDKIHVEAARTAAPATSLPYTVTVIDRDELEQQLALGNDFAQMLGNLIPSYSPSRQKMTNFGEKLRGRDPLIMIDGVPQTNPLRDGSRDGYTIDLDMVERIEVIHGANAIQGTGATGGIINLVTRKAESGQPAEFRTALGLTANDDLDSDSFGVRGHAQYAAGFDEWDVLLGATWADTGLFFDAEDRPIGVDPIQGDIMDGTEYDLFAKVGYEAGPQRFQLTVNRFEFESGGDWVNEPGDREAGIPATSAPGDVRGEPARNDVSTIAFDYTRTALGPGDFRWQLYHQDFAATFGGGAFGVFQDPEIGEDVFDQSENQSEKLGSKLTYSIPDLTERLDLTLGLDWVRDTTSQELIQTGRTWVPESDYVNWAPFLQAGYEIGNLHLSGGVRHETAELDVDDFTTIAFFGRQSVGGGSPDFDETLYNLGAVYRMDNGLALFANASEGFDMPDVGQVLRSIDEPGLTVNSFLELQPVIADNREAGLEYHGDSTHLRASYFQSESDFGTRLVSNADGIFSVKREATEIDGIELSGTWCPDASSCLGLNYANVDGQFDSNGDGALDSDLGGINISPDRLNLYWEQDWNARWASRLQTNVILDRDFFTRGEKTSEFDGYTTMDLVAEWRLRDGQRLQFAVENLLDEQYITYYSQVSPFAGEAGFFAGRGRNLSVTWRARW